MTSVPHLFCTLHNHNRTHIAATHSTFLSEYPSIALHRAGLWCYYTPLLVVYVLTPVAWLYVMPSALNGVVNEWKEKVLVMTPLSLLIYENAYANEVKGEIVVFRETELKTVHLSFTANPVNDDQPISSMTLCWPHQAALGEAAGAPVGWNIEKSKDRSSWQRSV